MKKTTVRLVSAIALMMAVSACDRQDKAEDSGQSQTPTATQEQALTSVPASQTPPSTPSALLAEDDAQMGKGVNGELPEPVYTYEGILSQAKGIIPSGNVYLNNYAKDIHDNKALWRQAVIPELRKIGKVPDNLDEAGIDRLFRQFLYLSGSKYLPVEEIDKFSYVVFKNDMTDPFTGRKLQEDVQINLEIVLDASGSMKKMIGDKTMMDIAKESINELIANLPQNSKVTLRVFGHKGNNQADGKEASCAGNELVVPLEPLDKANIQTALAGVAPTGWTSIAKSIEQGSQDLQGLTGEKNLNILYIITDGIETCGGDPLSVARQFKNNHQDIVLGIIGFNVDSTQNAVLQKIAGEAGGRYSSVYDSTHLVAELLKIHELAYAEYEWVTLDEKLLNQIMQNHKSSLYWQRSAQAVATSENNDLSDLLHVATIDASTGMPDPIIDFGGNVSKVIDRMKNERHDKIKAIYDAEIKKREQQSADYLLSLHSRMGEQVALIEVRSIFNPYSKYHKDYRDIRK